MKLATSIKPRGDGTVIVHGAAGVNHVFVLDESGQLVCDVPDVTAATLLDGSDNFFPADEADFEAAGKLLKAQAELSAAAAGAGGSSNSSDIDPDHPDDDPVNPDALPVESNTPPKSTKPTRRVSRKA